MNLNELHQVWNSTSNQPTPSEARKLAESFMRRVKRRRRFQAAWLIWTFLALSAISVLAIRGAAEGRGHTPLDWSLLLLLILPWAIAFHFLRRFLNEGTSLACGELSLAESLKAALASNRSARMGLLLVAILFVLMLSLLALAVIHLYHSGKVHPRELPSMIVFMTTALGLGATGMVARYFRCLRPEQRKLTALLDEIES